MSKGIIKKLKIAVTFCFIIFFGSILSNVDAASATISANPLNVTAGDSVNIYVNINAAAWNVHVNGTGVSDSIVGYNDDGVNQNVSKNYVLNTTNPGTYTVSISGDVTDESSTNSPASGTVTVVVNEKKQIDSGNNNNQNNNGNNNNNQNNNNNKNNNQNNNTNTKKDTRSKNANLSSLNIEGVELSPEFNADTTTYNATVKFDVSEINVSAIPQDNKSTTVVNGNMDLVEGDNNVTITVTAENGTKKVYTVIVKKEKNPDDLNAFLSSLVINNATLKTDFNQEIFEYMCDDISADIFKLDIVATTQIEGATCEIIGNDDLKPGINHITIKVTSKDGSESKEYKIIVFKSEDVLSMQEESATPEKKNIISLLRENIVDVVMYGFILVEFCIIVVLFTKLNKYKKRKLENEELKNDNIIEDDITKEVNENENLDEKNEENLDLETDIKSDHKEEETVENENLNTADESIHLVINNDDPDVNEEEKNEAEEKDSKKDDENTNLKLDVKKSLEDKNKSKSKDKNKDENKDKNKDEDIKLKLDLDKLLNDNKDK